MDVTIVIPTKNAGKMLNRTLKMVFSQKTKYTYEVICVDSGSKDNTLEIIKKYPCRLYQIKPTEFGHGKTRNFGASKGTGEFIIMITQDAAPATRDWLENFINAMKMDDKIAGGVGIHYPYENCNALDKNDLVNHFRNFGEKNTIYSLDETNMEKYKTDDGYRLYLVFFSDNNACLRRSVWEKYPYPDVNFAEDQIWMQNAMEHGYKKVYCPEAPVYHSHNFSIPEYYKRSFDEFKGLYDVLGYKIADSWWCLPRMWGAHVKRDIQNIRTMQMNRKEKVYWLIYSIMRSYCRYYAGYKGSMYHTYSERKKKRLDRKISQQYAQRKA